MDTVLNQSNEIIIKKKGRYQSDYVPLNSKKRLETFKKSCAIYHQNNRERDLERFRKYYILKKEVKRLRSIECF
jgi:hypothetical protein